MTLTMFLFYAFCIAYFAGLVTLVTLVPVLLYRVSKWLALRVAA